MAKRANRNGVGPRKPRPRDAKRATRWKGLVREWETSGLSQVEFCRRKKVSVHTFRWWRYTLRLREEDRSGAEAEQGDRPPFVEVKVAQPRSLASASGIAIEVPGGAVVRVQAGFDPAVLREVLAVLGANAC